MLHRLDRYSIGAAFLKGEDFCLFNFCYSFPCDKISFMEAFAFYNCCSLPRKVFPHEIGSYTIDWFPNDGPLEPILEEPSGHRVCSLFHGYPLLIEDLHSGYNHRNKRAKYAVFIPLLVVQLLQEFQEF